jgi:hypothetical protein
MASVDRSKLGCLLESKFPGADPNDGFGRIDFALGGDEASGCFVDGSSNSERRHLPLVRAGAKEAVWRYGEAAADPKAPRETLVSEMIEAAKAG